MPAHVLSDAVPPLTAHTAFSEWQLAPVVSVAVALLAIAYLVGVVRVRREHPSRPWPILRTAAFLAGLLVVVLATQSSIGAYDDVLFVMHMIQHLMLIMVAPPLFVAGRPVTLLLHASHNPVHRVTLRVIRSRVVTALTCPAVAAVIYAVVIVGTHLTGFMNETLRHPVVHDLEHLLYLVSGYLYFLPLLGSEPIKWKMSFPTRFLLLALSMPIDTFVGVVLIQTSSEPFPAYAAQHRTWGPSLISDIHAGGGVMWVGGDSVMFILVLCVFVVFLRDSRAHGSMGDWLENARRQTLLDHTSVAGVASPEPQRRRRGSTIDDDDHLAAYNAYLAQLGDQQARHSAGAASHDEVS